MTQTEWIISLDDDLKDHDELFVGTVRDGERLIRCNECIYYDPPHIEKDGQRYEYKDMPPEAFDPITKEFVSRSYGINVGGRCCRDYERGYLQDKRVYVPETNYCGRAERKEK